MVITLDLCLNWVFCLISVFVTSSCKAPNYAQIPGIFYENSVTAVACREFGKNCQGLRETEIKAKPKRHNSIWEIIDLCAMFSLASKLMRKKLSYREELAELCLDSLEVALTSFPSLCPIFWRKLPYTVDPL